MHGWMCMCVSMYVFIYCMCVCMYVWDIIVFPVLRDKLYILFPLSSSTPSILPSTLGPASHPRSFAPIFFHRLGSTPATHPVSLTSFLLPQFAFSLSFFLSNFFVPSSSNELHTRLTPAQQRAITDRPGKYMHYSTRNVRRLTAQ